VLKLNPALGRLTSPQDEPGLGESAVVVISYEYWQNRFGGNRGVLNQTLKVNGQPLKIIGVAPAGFTGTTIGVRPQVFVPLTLAWRVRPTAARNDKDRRAYWLYLFARLKPNVTTDQASASINSLFTAIHKDVEAPLNSNMAKDAMQRFLNEQIILQPGARGQSAIPQMAGQPLTLLFALTGLLLLIICVNIASLLLVRGSSRSGKMAIRASVGASRGQLVRQPLTESTVLAVIGYAAGLMVASTTFNLIMAMQPPDFTGDIRFGLNAMSIGFAAGTSVFSVALFGVLPAVIGTRTDLIRTIKVNAAQSLDGLGMARLRSALAIGQIAFSMVLLVLAGLFSKSLMNVAGVNLGMKVDSVVSFSVSPRLNGYTAQKTTAVFDRIEEELAAQPGVTGVTSAKVAPITDSSGNGVDVEGFEPGPGFNAIVLRNEVSPSFFNVLSIPLLAGRNFNDADRLGMPKVAIVNQSFVHRFNLGTTAIGKHFSGYPYDNVRKVELEIIGVVADAAYSNVKDGTPPQYFQPRRQSEDPDSVSLLCSNRNGSRCGNACHPGHRFAHRFRSARQFPDDDATAGAKQCLPRPACRGAFGGLRGARHAAGGHRSVWHACLQCSPPDTGIRTAPGIGRRTKLHARDRAAAGRMDDVDRRKRRISGRCRSRPGGRGPAVRFVRTRPVGAGRCGDSSFSCRACRRLLSGTASR
jgi:predicted permease